MQKSVDLFLKGIENKDIAILSKAITLVESTNKEDFELANQLLKRLLLIKEQNQIQSKVIGITGLPGAGKSTFINLLGKNISSKSSLAVLSVDPSSSKTGGSILGDKTRMGELASLKNVYIRPSPSSGHLGGVGARSQETLLVLEAFAFDFIFVESVGVGQSESELSQMVDLSILLTISGGGDELQGIKRGILEDIDWLIVNKADGDNKEKAIRYAKEMESALQILQGSSKAKVFAISSLDGFGIDALNSEIEIFFKDKTQISERRNQQKLSWLKKAFMQKILMESKNNQDLQNKFKKLEDEIALGKSHPLDIY